MKRCLFTLFTVIFHLFSLNAQQHSLSGRITSASDGAPVPHASVYVDGSTNGCTSGKDGSFTLEGIYLPAELVCSHLSYKLQSQVLNDTSKIASVVFRLEDRHNSIREVSVMGKDKREEYLERFLGWYLGNNYSSVGAELLNDSVLYFLPGEGKDFEAVASAPLEISVSHSAYHIRCDLQHFCRSLYRNQLAENGYLMQALCPDLVEQGGRGSEFQAFSHSYQQDASGRRVQLLTDIKCREFTICYYHRRNQPLDLSYLYPHPNNLFRSSMFFEGDTVRIYSSGRSPDNRIIFTGIISHESVAHMLPEDYIPSMQ